MRLLLFLFNIAADGLVEICNSFHITAFCGVNYAVLNMALENKNAGAVKSGFYCRELHQNFGAILAVLYHLLNMLQMSYSSRKAVHNGLGLLRGVGVSVFAVTVMMSVIMVVVVGDAMLVHIGVIKIVHSFLRFKQPPG